ncbi:DNA-directed DNA polymerase, partial [Tanacetum coccineum]
DRRKLEQFTQFRFHSLTEEEGWNRIEEYVQYQDDLWDDMSSPMNISSISEAMQPTFKGHLKRACNQIFYLETPTREVGLKNFYLIYENCRGSHEADKCKQTSQVEQVFLSRGDNYNDPSLLRFYQNDDTSPWGNIKRKEKGANGPEWIVRNKGGTEKEGPEGAEPSITQEPTPRPSILYQPSKTSNLLFPSRLKKQKKDDEDKRLLSIFKQIHINLPFVEAMIHMLKGAKVLKDLLSHKEKLEKAASSVKLSEECSAIIQRSLSQKEGDLGSFTLPCLIRPLAVKNAMADLGASINLMPHSLFRRLRISKLKPTKMSIQLADRSIKYLIRVCENLLVKVSKFIFPVDFILFEMDEDELFLVILGLSFLAMARAVIDEQWVDTINYDGKWTEEEEEEDSSKALVVSFYPRVELIEPLEWKAPEN